MYLPLPLELADVAVMKVKSRIKCGPHSASRNVAAILARLADLTHTSLGLVCPSLSSSLLHLSTSPLTTPSPHPTPTPNLPFS